MGSVTAACRYGKPESEWKRARDTVLVRCAQEWARSEARGTLTGAATQAKQRQLRVYSILSRQTPIPGIVPFLRLFPRLWESQVPVGAIQSRSALEERAHQL